MGTLTDYQKMEQYLRDPEGEADAFWEAGPLLWVDWRDYDEWILQGICDLPRGSDILLERNGALMAIPYAPDRMDRDTTLKAAQARIAPDYQLRCFLPSAGNDTIGFCLLSAAEWRELEAAFGPQAVARQFQPIGPESRLFG